MIGEDKNRVGGLFLCAVGMLIASFMPWGSIEGTPKVSVSGMPFGGGFNPFAGMSIKLDLNGWIGTTSVFGLESPNWVPVVFAVVVAILAWLSSSRIYRSPLLMLPILSGWGLIHLLILISLLAFSSKATVGLGVVLALALYIGLFWLSISFAKGMRAASSG